MQATSENSSLELTTLEFAGEKLDLHTSGALWWTEQKLLVVADLHLEKGIFIRQIWHLLTTL